MSLRAPATLRRRVPASRYRRSSLGRTGSRTTPEPEQTRFSASRRARRALRLYLHPRMVAGWQIGYLYRRNSGHPTYLCQRAGAQAEQHRPERRAALWERSNCVSRRKNGCCQRAHSGGRARLGLDRRSASLVVWDEDGNNPRRIYHDEKTVMGLQWSQDGNFIAYGAGSFFAARVRQPGRIMIIKPDGTGAHIVTEEAGNAGFPGWSPDGKQIVYRYWTSAGGRSENRRCCDQQNTYVDR